jgi:hypothetical protein
MRSGIHDALTTTGADPMKALEGVSVLMERDLMGVAVLYRSPAIRPVPGFPPVTAAP